MEKQKERVLAYALATSIDNDELDKVSGGNTRMTTRQTIRITGTGGGADVVYDISADW